MERHFVDAMIERERKIRESKQRMDKYREMSWSRNTNPDTTMPNCLPPDKKYKNRQMEIDDVLIKK